MSATTYKVPGLVITDRDHVVPLDHARPDGPSISVFTREVAEPDGLDKPYLVYLQGGPGFEAARPSGPPSGWQKRALKDFRLLFLDQRGTGRSTPLNEIPGSSPPEQAAYLTNFRADSIVRDAERIRQELGIERWSILGQSFGGFCAMTYLSIAPDGLREAFITGGLAPIGWPVDSIYGATWRRTLWKNRKYFERYPADRPLVDDILKRLDNEDVRLPSGDPLTARRFLQLGLAFGMSDGFENTHHIIEMPFGSRAFLADVEAAVSFGRNPIYATLHESCYADGSVTGWSAARTMPVEAVEGRSFSAEHIFPWMFEDYGALHSHQAAANLLAEHQWPRLYDPEQLARNEVPVAAAVYYDDIYVLREFAEATIEAIRGLKPWITNEFEHNGLRADGERVLGRLIDLARGRE